MEQYTYTLAPACVSLCVCVFCVCVCFLFVGAQLLKVRILSKGSDPFAAGFFLLTEVRKLLWQNWQTFLLAAMAQGVSAELDLHSDTAAWGKPA